MAMGRLNRPSIMMYGGTIAAGHYNGQELNIVSTFEALGQKIMASLMRIHLKISFAMPARRRRVRRYVHCEHDGISD
jgi:dihydroxyacid dehydratase/phosphogluconate dehydratase